MSSHDSFVFRSKTLLDEEVVAIKAADLQTQLSLDTDAFFHSAEEVGLRNTLYLRDSGEAAAISGRDIYQGGIGDCYFLSPLGAIAIQKPAAIQNMIRENGDGTFNVSLWKDANGGKVGWGTTNFQKVDIKVDQSFAANGVNRGSANVAGDQKEIWAQVVEKAYATLQGGYAAISKGGYTALASAELTGFRSTYTSAAKVTETVLQQRDASDDVIVFDSFAKGGLPYGVVGSHAYYFDSLVNTAQGTMVKLLNPWGFADPALIPVSQLSKCFASATFCDI